VCPETFESLTIPETLAVKLVDPSARRSQPKHSLGVTADLGQALQRLIRKALVTTLAEMIGAEIDRERRGHLGLRVAGLGTQAPQTLTSHLPGI